mgnify:CR=1 FL=1
MRELAVFYCPKCGHYAYYQTSRHPQCPKCGTQEAMHMVRMHYTEFMRMSCDERDEFLSREILKTNPSLITRLTEPHKRYNSRCRLPRYLTNPGQRRSEWDMAGSDGISRVSAVFRGKLLLTNKMRII